MLLRHSISTQKAAGIFITTRTHTLPDSACPLERFCPDNLAEYSSSKSPLPPVSEAYTSRLKSVARYLGHLHSNEDMMDDNLRILELKSGNGAEGRYREMLYRGKLQENQNWLKEHGLCLELTEVDSRVQRLISITQTSAYKAHWIVCVGNVDPSEVMVDEIDSSQVYCLYDARGGALSLADRMEPLARLAFCSKLPRSYIQDVLLTPYAEAFEEKSKGKEKAVFTQKFWLILHVIFLDYFIYWTEFKNPVACSRIQGRLLEDDDLLDQELFGPQMFKRFSTITTV